MGSKREVPAPLQAILKLDAVLSNNVCFLVSQFVKTDKIKGLLYALEISCHAFLWFAVWPVYIWTVWRRDLFQMQVNFFIGLVIDIIAIAVLKAFIRRRRPPGNKVSKLQSMSPDAYSFPSGHVSRSFLVYLFFTHLFPVSTFWSAIILSWAIAVSLSRLLLRMHYLLDLVGGFFVAVVNYYLISWIWISQSTCNWIVQYITDERLDGGEYHV